MIKTKSLIESKKIFNFLLLIGAIFIFIAPFVHINFSKKNANTEVYKKKLYSENIKPLEEEKKELIKSIEGKNEFNQGKFKKYLDLENLIQIENKKYKRLVKAKIEKNSFQGWHTTRSFLIAFGNRFPTLIFCLIISYLVQLLNTKDRHLKNTLRYLQLLCYTIAFYQIIWCFWNYKDYPLKYYRYIIIIVSFIVSVMFINFVHYKKALRNRLTLLIRDLFSFIFEETEAKDFVKESKKHDFRKRRIELAEKAVEME